MRTICKAKFIGAFPTVDHNRLLIKPEIVPAISARSLPESAWNQTRVFSRVIDSAGSLLLHNVICSLVAFSANCN